MSGTPTLLYLEADDEITAVVRRLRAAEPGRVVIVAPGRSRATSSAVALRLLARAAEADARDIAVVGDGLTRSLAAEAGITAFSSVDEARRGDLPDSPAPAAPSHATIHVMRGPGIEDSAPTLAAAAVPAAGIGSDDVTRPVPVVRAPRHAASGTTPRRGGFRALPVVAIAGLALLLVAATTSGALLLPAATVTIVPRTEPLGPVDYSIQVPDPAHETGTAEASATVTATDTYEVSEAATGTVTLFNWTIGSVLVPAGTFVAAGEQAFATQADVTVPRGRLTLFGTILAGEIDVAVVAAAPGPAANVPAEAINVIVNGSVDAQLRGFPENPEARVINRAATEGGVEQSGPVFSEADVQAAVADLTAQLQDEVAAAASSDDESIVVHVGSSEPTITGADDLVGQRDQPEVEISGALAWEAMRVARSDARDVAVAQLPAEATVPPGSEIVPGSESVQFVNARAAGDAVEVDVSVTASSSAVIDEDGVADRIDGMTPEEATSELSDLGAATIELWPGWASTVPSMAWRVEVVVAEPEPEAAGRPHRGGG